MERTEQNNQNAADSGQGIFSGFQSGDGGMNRHQYRNSDTYRDEASVNRNSASGRIRCEGCPYGRKSGHTALIMLTVTSVVALLIAFLATLICLLCLVLWIGHKEQNTKAAADEPSYGETAPYKEAAPETEAPKEDSNRSQGKTEPESESMETGDYYGDIKDAIRTDLDYSIDWDNYIYEGNNDKISIEVDYPVVKGEVQNIDIVNQVIAQETEYFEEYYKEYSQYMLADEMFSVYAEGNVTYMDEELMSIVFCETISTDYWQDYGLFCINVDMDNGVVIENSSIVNADQEFAVDFRIRSREQNGNVEALEYMTDMEIAYYLSNAGTAIVFYTPLGMEVGLNYGESYLTVTYKDYEQYLKKY